MFGFLGKIFGSNKATEDTIKTIANGFDELYYSDQEKSEAQAKAVDVLLHWAMNTSGQNLARRFLAVSLTMLWGVIYGVKVLLVSIAPFIDDIATSEAMMLSAKALESSAHEMNGAMMLILSFYFAAPYVGKVVDPFIEKFGKVKKNP